MQERQDLGPATGLGDNSRQTDLLLNSVTDYAIYMLDTEGVIRSWNAGAQHIKGYAEHEVIGTHYSRFYLPEDVQADRPALNLKRAASEGRFLEEGWRLRKDGRRFRAFVVIDPIFDGGELIGFAKVTRDVTERYESEQRLIQAQHALLQSQKLEAVGKLTLGLAHDFNNLLAIVLNSLDLIGAKSQDPDIQKLVAAGLRASERGALLTRQLLTFGRGQPLAPERAQVNHLLVQSKDMFQRAAGSHVTLQLQLDNQVPAVDVDVAQFEAAVLNLVCNSRDAMPRGGAITITTSMHRERDTGAGTDEERDFVVVAVDDTGEGIPFEHQERVFEPFFTTKEVGRGSGLGLSQVFGFASQSGGFATLDSVPGSGTRVVIHLPARAREKA